MPLEYLVEFKSSHEKIDNFCAWGIYPIFSYSKDIQKRTNKYVYDREVLILRSAGSIKNVTYFSGKFSADRHIYTLFPESKYIFWLLETIERFIYLFEKTSKGQKALTQDIKNYVVSLPPDELLNLFNEFARPIQMKIDNLIKKQEILRKIKIELIEKIYSQSIEVN